MPGRPLGVGVVKPFQLLRRLARRPRDHAWLKRHNALGPLQALTSSSPPLARRANHTTESEGSVWEATVEGIFLAMRLGIIPDRPLTQGQAPWTTSRVPQTDPS